MNLPPIRTFSYHYRQKYGHAVGKIALAPGIRCPNRREGGCVFCRSASFTPSYLSPEDAIEQQLKKGKNRLRKSKFTCFFAYFQQESCTVLGEDLLLFLLSAVLEDGDCIGVILSTRPDMVPQSLLDKLSQLHLSTGKEILLELGLQSSHDRSLVLLNRNHTVQDFIDSARRIKGTSGLQLGVHLIFGIPGESSEDMLKSVRFASDLGMDAVKLHHLQVVHTKELARWSREGKITLFELDGYLQLLLEVLPLIPSHVVVHRMWTTSHPELLIAPRWNILTAELSKRLVDMMNDAGIWQGKKVE